MLIVGPTDGGGGRRSSARPKVPQGKSAPAPYQREPSRREFGLCRSSDGRFQIQTGESILIFRVQNFARWRKVLNLLGAARGNPRRKTSAPGAASNPTQPFFAMEIPGNALCALKMVMPSPPFGADPAPA
jgi:hypothetical protein